VRARRGDLPYPGFEEYFATGVNRRQAPSPSDLEAGELATAEHAARTQALLQALATGSRHRRAARLNDAGTTPGSRPQR
jgi:hypothetical protein